VISVKIHDLFPGGYMAGRALSDPLRDHARLYGPRWDNRHYGV